MKDRQPKKPPKREEPYDVTVRGAPETPESLARGAEVVRFVLAIARKRRRHDDKEAA